MRSLDSLKPGESGTVRGFTQEDAIAYRLMQMGFIEGEKIDVIRRAPAGDPIEVKILGYSLSLRASEAQTILIELVE